MKIWKEVISPGPVWYKDEKTGQPACLDVTTDMVNYWFDQGKAMLAAGLSIPAPLEHQKTIQAMTAADRAAAQLINNAGWVEDYAVRPGNVLYAKVNVEDEDTARKLPRTIKFTSPYFNTFTDGDGKKWEGVISHLALTSRPRIKRQEPFRPENVAAALSLDGPARTERPTGLFLSRAGRLQRRPGKPAFLPHYPQAFSILAGIALAEGYDEEEEKPKEKATPKAPPKDKKGPPSGKDKDGARSPEAEGESGEHEGREENQSVSGMEVHEEEMEMCDVLCDMVSALWGIELPEGTTEKNLMQRLLKALMDHLKLENGQLLEDEEEEDEELDMASQNQTNTGSPPNSPVIQEQPPVYMSLEQVNALPEGDLKKMAQAMLSLQSQSDALKKNAFDGALARRNDRIKRIAKKVGRTGYEDKLLAQAKDIGLSLGADGKVNDPFDRVLDLIDEGARDLPALVLSGGQVTEQDHPQEAGKVSEERRKEIVAEQRRNSGIRQTA